MEEAQGNVVALDASVTFRPLPRGKYSVSVILRTENRILGAEPSQSFDASCARTVMPPFRLLHVPPLLAATAMTVGAIMPV
jgi:hypothetical protein